MKKLCRNCEYFDGGGERAVKNNPKKHGDCLNILSPRFQTYGDQTCKWFTPSSELTDEKTNQRPSPKLR